MSNTPAASGGTPAAAGGSSALGSQVSVQVAVAVRSMPPQGGATFTLSPVSGMVQAAGNAAKLSINISLSDAAQPGSIQKATSDFQGLFDQAKGGSATFDSGARARLNTLAAEHSAGLTNPADRTAFNNVIQAFNDSWGGEKFDTENWSRFYTKVASLPDVAPPLYGNATQPVVMAMPAVVSPTPPPAVATPAVASPTQRAAVPAEPAAVSAVQPRRRRRRPQPLDVTPPLPSPVQKAKSDLQGLFDQAKGGATFDSSDRARLNALAAKHREGLTNGAERTAFDNVMQAFNDSWGGEKFDTENWSRFYTKVASLPDVAPPPSGSATSPAAVTKASASGNSTNGYFDKYYASLYGPGDSARVKKMREDLNRMST